MEETGDRYTDAAQAVRTGESDKVVSAAIKDLLDAREDGALSVSLVLQKFHEEHHARGEWQATLGSHVVDHLWPGAQKPLETEKLRELLTRYQTDQTIGDSGVRQRSVRHREAVRQAGLAFPKSQLFEDWKAKARADLPPMTDEDKSFYDRTAGAPSLTPADLEGMTETQVLQNMWEYAPDVSHKFGMPAVPKRYGWDQDRKGDHVKQGARAYFPESSGGSSILTPENARIEMAPPEKKLALPIHREGYVSSEEFVRSSAEKFALGPHDAAYYEFGKEGEPPPFVSPNDSEATMLADTLGRAQAHTEVKETLQKTEEGLREQRRERIPNQNDPVIKAMDAVLEPEHEAEIERLREKLKAAGIDPDA